ncbi:spore germination protein [Paenibacillus sacheonensis]|uniref:Spore germination protein n=1 Tax=Paenibacillus sacheonensis TaxID=742054 RepID=A0A7X4YN35_9BACL|nr:spore germination protein [Paenibacillus sacheonensis]MBM7564853.1 spore germination protein [Paenibacillus sacheonensis]NBC69401.1 spore germination protein [Paenibacillus sacheonensis]
MKPFHLQAAVPGLEPSSDLVSRTLNVNQESAQLIYLSTLCDKQYIQSSIMQAFDACGNLAEFNAKLTMIAGFERIKNGNLQAEKLLHGFALVVFPDAICAIEAKKASLAKPSETSSESIIQGPQKAFSEDLEQNVQIIRTRYPSKNLNVEYTEIGTESRTQLAILYDKAKVDPDILLDLDKRLAGVEAAVVQASNQVQMLLTSRFEFFPTALVTDRPDRTALSLSKGKVILLLNGTPFSINLPAVFYDFMVSMDDAYQSPWLTRPLLILRYMAVFITTALPALYVAAVSYNPEFFQTQLAIEIAGSRAAVPYASFYEVFFMLFMTEALTEASIRLPKHIGSTATTVGGLILGQAAQEAGLVSSIMIIIASSVAVSNFVIPINTMSYSMRLIKFPLVICAMYFGLVGVVTGIFCFIVYAASLRSFGRPYLKLFIGEAKKSR